MKKEEVERILKYYEKWDKKYKLIININPKEVSFEGDYLYLMSDKYTFSTIKCSDIETLEVRE